MPGRDGPGKPTHSPKANYRQVCVVCQQTRLLVILASSSLDTFAFPGRERITSIIDRGARVEIKAPGGAPLMQQGLWINRRCLARKTIYVIIVFLYILFKRLSLSPLQGIVSTHTNPPADYAGNSFSGDFALIFVVIACKTARALSACPHAGYSPNTANNS
ncbi:MAG: hypothetical protein PHP02_05355 [Eubacteriales bacterium]|nr:hypothetical protein [Eubacteriales bacterium]